MSHDQMEMFNIHLEYEGEDGIICKKCGVRQPPQNFEHRKSGEIKHKCRACQRRHSQTVTRLKRETPYPPSDYSCPICEKTLVEIAVHGQKNLQQWVLDHCHDTDTFRGWICFNCNSGLGSFNDDIETAKRAVNYLEAHQNENSS